MEIERPIDPKKPSETRGPRAEDIKTLFASVSHGYDSANDAMTFGMARLWRKQLVRWSGAKAGERVLDCATGTGDLAIEFKKALGNFGQVVGVDFCPEMLDQAQPKCTRQNLKIRFQVADAMELPFEDAEFNVCSIAYGIRNVANPLAALSEMARVLKPGGRLMVLETGDTPNGALKPMFNFYIRKIVPRIGGWITGRRDAYEYLNNSSRTFPSRERFVELIDATGKFRDIEFQVLMGGASFLYRAVKKA